MLIAILKNKLYLSTKAHGLLNPGKIRFTLQDMNYYLTQAMKNQINIKSLIKFIKLREIIYQKNMAIRVSVKLIPTIATHIMD